MEVDVIIPVYKPGKELFSLLDSLKRQSLPPGKIILMNTGKEYFDDLTESCKFEERYPGVEVHHLAKSEFDHGGTRRRGVEYSCGEVFVCMTQDAKPADSYLLEKLVRNLGRDVAVAYARQLPGEESSELERASRRFNYPETSCKKGAGDLKALGVKTFFCSNVCAAYRRDVYEKLGGFEERAIFNEDMVYAAGAVKAGYSIVYEAEARVIHSHDYTNIMQLRRNFDLGVSQADHPEIFGAVASEREGKKFVGETWRYLKEMKKLHKFPGFCVQCCFKYAGYLLGKRYRRLPRAWILKLTSNRDYWNHVFTITS